LTTGSKKWDQEENGSRWIKLNHWIKMRTTMSNRNQASSIKFCSIYRNGFTAVTGGASFFSNYRGSRAYCSYRENSF